LTRFGAEGCELLGSPRLAKDVERAARATSDEEAKLGRNLLELLEET
jgi:hypothetical protein